VSVAPCQYKDKSPQAKSAATFRSKPRQSSMEGGSEWQPPKVLPRHVRACQHSPDRRERWYVWTWKRGAPAVQTRVPYSCNSWRCPECARHEAAVTFARIKEAVGTVGDPSGWVFAVLTIDRNGYYTGKPWADVTSAYRELGRMSERFLKRLRRAYGLGSEWVAVVEMHRSGWPHINLMLHCPELAAALRAAKAERAASGATERESILLSGELLDHAMDVGWGRQSTAEAAKDTDALAGYIVKLAGNHDATVGELAKMTQAPTTAPARFRRLRSGKGFLPPRRSNPEVTGVLVRRRRAAEGDWETLGINQPKDAAQVEPCERALAAEMDLIREEEDLLSRGRGKLPAMPPVRLAHGGQLEGLRDASERRWAESVEALAREYPDKTA